MPAWLKTPATAAMRAKLAELSWDAHGVWWALELYCAAGNSPVIAKRKIETACDRRVPAKRLTPAVAELIAEGLLTDHGDTVEHVIWHQIPDEIWNDPVLRERDIRRKRLYNDHELCKRIKDRDRNRCRYCGIRVEWGNQKGPAGGTYDHIDPDGDNRFGNVVVSCRKCNGIKKDRTPEQAGMELLRPGTTDHDLESRRCGVSSSATTAAVARPSRPRSGAPPGRIPIEHGSNPVVDSPARARETGPDRTGIESDLTGTGQALPPRPGAGPDHADDLDRLDSLAACQPPEDT
jgi:hypothetical protein